ncbi:MAG: branched-chain amino acid transaminase [Anaerolineae bacterium]|nr:branched-chain amino acid transaminase [Anaerolineae bacterium]MDW8071808.1 branched-chain amino acid transaminase [Anaerolineae bacterium]
MPISKAEVIWFNGEFVPWDEAKVHVLSHVLHYGSSVFEGIRAYKTERGPAVLGLMPHIERLFFSAKVIRMEIPYSKQEIAEAIKATIRRNRHEACYIRPLVFRGYDSLGVFPLNCPVETVIATWEWGAYLGAGALEQGVDVGVSSWRRMAPDTSMAMAKIGGQYVNSQLVVMEARARGLAEGIVLDIYGYVSEGSGENIFVVYDGVIYTPPLSASILGGITRRIVLQLAEDLGYPVREQNIPREMLYAADEVFFTGTAAEITPIRTIDGLPVGAGGRGPITKQLQDEFFAIIEGRKPDRHGWLTPVYE